MPALLLRPWQQRALDALAACAHPDFLAVATPGAGKTTFALAALAGELSRQPAPAVVVAPTAHLKVQWAAAAAVLGLHLDPDWLSGRPFSPDMHGIVTTYQQVASAALDLASRTRGGVVVLDEVHHAGDDRAWGDAVALAFGDTRRRIALSGTPFRSDTQAIPFVRYEQDEAVPDVEYGYADALADGVVRPVYFPRIDGDMEWVAPDGAHHAASFAEQLDRTLTAQRLRTALSVEGQWLPQVLLRANRVLVRLRQSHPTAGALAIAMDTEHARGVARLLRQRCGVEAVVATSEDPDASAAIAAFATSSAPWIVAVRMISEGVDIPRLRVGVYATTTSTELFFRQAIGRLVRVTPDTRGMRAVMFLPDDPRLRTHSLGISESRRHLLRRMEGDGEVDPMADPLGGMHAADREQMSLFQAVAATATAESSQPEWFDSQPFPQADVGGVPLELLLPPTPGGRLHAATGLNGSGLNGSGLNETAPAKHVTKAHMRQLNADLARVLARRANLDHRAVNAELNRKAGIRRISDATVDQLERRLEHGEKWLARLSLMRG
ncbi:MAG TPA: DEAD/DEAH box helicase [Euzebya sp.]|nr:DEAD/DEAH box helicase [Euzebya sp.]